MTTDTPIAKSDKAIKIAALYKFVPIADPVTLQTELRALTARHNVLGMLILATEGINGTVAASPEAMDAFLTALHSDARFTEGVEIKFSFHHTQPFYRMRISVKKEIVTMGVENFTRQPSSSIHDVDPKEWNALLQREDVLVIDTRNNYEYTLGSFAKAINPHTESFREFPAVMAEQFDKEKHKHVAMFCTGGIRCEKASSFLAQLGYEHVYNLKGGILKYLEEIPENESVWRGECFVFDQRVAVKHGLVPGESVLCRGCRHPLTTAETQREDFQEGVHCLYCVGKLTEDKKNAALQRDRQIQLAAARQQKHLGYQHPGHANNRKRKLGTGNDEKVQSSLL